MHETKKENTNVLVGILLADEPTHVHVLEPWPRHVDRRGGGQWCCFCPGGGGGLLASTRNKAGVCVTTSIHSVLKLGQSSAPCVFSVLVTFDWFASFVFSIEPLVLVEGTWEPSQSKPPIGGNLI